MRLWYVYVCCFMLLSTTFESAAAQATTVRFRVIHASPDTPPMDVFLDGQLLLSNVAFGSISNYQNVTGGVHTLAVAPVGAGAQSAALSEQVDLSGKDAASVAVVGLGDIRVVSFSDNLSAPPSGKARVRVAHFSPDAPGANIEVINGPTLVPDLEFGKASDYLTVDAGAYDLRLVTAGNNTVIVQLPNTRFEAGTIYDVVAMGRLADIQVKVGTFVPGASSASTAGAAGSSNPQATMPSTGIEASGGLLIGALIVVTIGLVMRSWLVWSALHKQRRW